MVTGYFALLLMNAYWLKSNSPVVSFLQEALTIPVLILQGILWGVAAYKIVRQRVGSRHAIASLLLLTITSVFTYGSLFGSIKTG